MPNRTEVNTTSAGRGNWNSLEVEAAAGRRVVVEIPVRDGQQVILR
jgi:hypothetical protein